MATAPTSRKLNLTRDQLATFLSDQQQIRQFELLFSTVDQLQVIVGTDFEFQADTAAANANNALAQIIALAQDTAVDDAVLNAKVQQALDAIPGLAQALELMSLSPRQELGTIASQNSDNVNIKGGLIYGLDVPLPVASGGIGVTTAAANQVFAGPTTGAAAAPAFRALTSSDVPPLGYVTSVAALTLGTTGTDLSSTVANPTTTPVITLNVPTASTTNRGALSSTDWNTFNGKQAALVSGTNIKTVGGVTLLGAGDVSAPSFTTVITSSLVDATTPNIATTGGFRLRGNATSGTAYLQVTNSTASAEWGYASVVASGLWTWSGAFTATTITASTQFSGAGTGLTGTASGLSVGGNAATATALQTARNIGGVSFNGTADINLPGVNTTGNQNTSGNAATATNVAGSGITGSRGIPKAAMPAGTVLQVVSATYSTQVSTSSSTYADTGLTATITPTSSTSTILVIVSQSNVAKDTNNTGANIRLLRGASALSTAAIIAAYDNTSGANNVGSVSLNYLDSPATTSATTYKTQVASNGNNAACSVQTNGSTSYITLMEIAA